MRVYLIRHGESIDSANEIHQRDNTILSEKGRIQANKAAQYLLSTNITFDHIHTSPLNRSVETCQIIHSYLKNTEKIEIDKNLTEEKLPDVLIGKSSVNRNMLTIQHDYMAEYYLPFYKSEQYKNADNFLSVNKRATSFLTTVFEIYRRNNFSNILAASHSVIIKTILSNIISSGENVQEVHKTTLQGIHLSNCGIVAIEYLPLKQRWQIVEIKNFD